MHRRKTINNILTFICLFVIAIIMLLPIIWCFVTSIKTDVQMFAIPPKLIPKPATVKHYLDITVEGKFFSYLRNSLLVTVISCSISMLFGIPAAYGFAKYTSKRMEPTFWAVTAIRMIPPIAMVLPYFMLMRSVQLSDSIWSLVIAYIPFEITLIVWMMNGFFKQVPVEVEEAAEIDGLSPWGILFRIALPLSKSSVGVTALMAFVFAWNEFMFALSLTSTSASQTLTIGIAGFVTSFQTFWGRMSAMGILFIIPALLLTFVFQKDLVKGLTGGAVKG